MVETKMNKIRRFFITANLTQNLTKISLINKMIIKIK